MYLDIEFQVSMETIYYDFIYKQSLHFVCYYKENPKYTNPKNIPVM